jgi:hypothetical protein
MPPRELTDDYRLEKILASSRGGSILRASRIDNGQTVVIKLINVPGAADPAAALKATARFRAYAAGLAALRHPNLPLILDSGLTPDGGAFLVMEKVDGVGFDAACAPGGGGAALDRILPLLAQALAGLEELARHGLAHLNLSPENLFLVPAAPAATTVTGAVPAPATSALDRTGGGTGGGAPEQTVKLLGLGTPLFHLGEPWPDASNARFRAPELALAAAARETMPDWHADCYALAQTACYGLGITVAVGDLAGTLMHTVQMPLALSFELANDEALRQILERCLRQSPRERPSHGAIRNAFRLALGGIELPGGAASPGRHQPEPAPRPSTAPSAAGPEAMAGASATPAKDAAAGADAGDDSSLDLFHVPATLPALPGMDESHGTAGEPLGHPFADSLELPQLDELFASSPHPPGVELPRVDELFASSPHPPGVGGFSDLDLGADAAPPPAPPWPAGDDRPSRPAGPPASGVAAAALSSAGSAAAAPKGDVGAPPAVPEAGEMLSGVDELLGSLPPPPPLAPPVAPRGARGRPGGRGRAGAAAAPAQGRPAPAFAAAPSPGAAALAFGRKLLAPLLALPRPVLLAGAAALLLAAGFLTWILFAHRSRQAPGAARQGTVVEAAAAPPLRPGRSAAAKFFDARSYLIFGRESDARVRQALRELTYADQGALGRDGCRQLAAIQQTLAAAALETVPQDLASGLRGGDLDALESVVEVASDRDLPPRQLGDLARARNLVNHYELARAAAAAGDHAQVLQRFRAMEGMSRTLRDPLELRDRAAQALEDDAHALAAEGRYDEALRQLGPLLRDWPERAGIKELAKRYETASASETQQQALLDSVPSYESRRKPSEALDLLRPMQPTPHLEQRFAEAKQRLEAQLARLDAEPPQVVLRPGYALDYWRGTVITLSFRVTDDYEVKSVKVFARPESGRMTELPLKKSGFGWDVSIPPSFHQNGTVELYVVATDLSGHEGYLGSKENPLRLQRRQGFQQLLH